MEYTFVQTMEDTQDIIDMAAHGIIQINNSLFDRVGNVSLFDNAVVNYSFLLDTGNSTSNINDHIGVGTVFVGIILGILICFTLIGNGLVVTAVATSQRLRSVTNMFIVSLAIADITVALLVMPFSLLVEVYGAWRFGYVFCHFWISCDVTCCTASLLHLCVISLDRYLAITQPLTYKRRMSKTRAVAMIAGVWSTSVAISFVPIFMGWYATQETQDKIYLDSAECGLHQVNRYYAVISSSLSFWIPLFVMVFAYVKIFRIARHQAAEIQKLENSLYYNSSPTCSTNGKKEKVKKRSKRLTKDAKAIKTLGILMGLFILCWLPFFLMYMIVPFCPYCEIPALVASIITWLGYVNSFFNPCVYAFLNRDFRMAFSKILSCGNVYHWWCCHTGRVTNRRSTRSWAANEDHENSSSLCENMVVENGHRKSSRQGSTTSMIHHGLKVVDIPLTR